MKKLLLILICFPLFIFSQDQKRLALVIGNANYDKGVLNNPVNDATLISKTLKKLNFDVILGTNIPDRDSFKEKIREFGNRRADYDVAFVYYAGHGIQVGSENYLLPTKEVFESEYDVEDYGVSVQDIMRYLTGMSDQVNILILDACRDNPFEVNWNKKRSIKGGGLAKIPPPNGSLIAFSTDAGMTANDGDGVNSIYCESLSRNLLKPNTEINQVFKNVRTDVLKSTDGLQSPVENSKLTGDAFYLLIEKDYSKIELKKLQKNAELEKEKGNIKAAINKYTILEIYLKGNMENIDKQKLIKVYLDMGQIYYQMSDVNSSESEPSKFYEANKENWDAAYLEEYNSIKKNYLTKSANSFLNAKLLLEIEGINTKKNTEYYSESFYKYLRCQSYLDYADRGIDTEVFIKYINQLIDFNEEKFGTSDYRTASAYYLSGIFQHESDPITAYQHLVKSSEIFTRSKYKDKDLDRYALTLSPVFPYIWSINAFNSILESGFEKGRVNEESAKDVISDLRESINISMQSLYRRNVQIINEGIEMSKKHDNNNIDGIFKAAFTFFHNFPIIISKYDNETGNSNYAECQYAAIRYRDSSLQYSNSPEDSVLTYINNAISYTNLSYIIDTTNYDSLKKIKEIVYNLRKDAFDIAIRIDSYVFTSFNYILESYYYDFLDSLNHKEDFEIRFNKIDKLFSNYMTEYRSQEDQSSWNVTFNEYIGNMWLLVRDKFIDREDVILKFTEHYIKIVMNNKDNGYGHYEMVEAYNYKANQYLNFGKIQEAKKIYIDILDHIDNNKSDWIASEKDTEDGIDISQIILIKYSYGFSNYLLAMTDYHEGEYSENDSILIKRCEFFLENEIKSLSETNILWRMKLKLLDAKIYYDWSGEFKQEILTYCDEALSILDQLNKNEKMRSSIGWSTISQYQIETWFSHFYDLKLSYIESHKPKDNMLITVNNRLISIARNWKKKEKIFPIMNAKSNIVWYYFKTSNYSKYKSSSLEAFNIGEEFLNQDDFSSFRNPIDAKLLLLMKTGRFLVHATELVNKPKEVDRLKCIEFYKSIEKYIVENYDSVKISSDSYGFPNLRQVYYTLADQFYFIDNFEEAMNYHVKDLELTKQISNNIISKEEEIKVLRQIWSVSEETKNDSISLHYYTQYVDKIDEIDTSINIKYSIIDKDYSTCSIPFLCLKIITKKNVWPCLEFDIDRNREVSLRDKRYYIDKDRLVVEKITKIESDIGGYFNQGINKKGEVSDTSSNIFFEKNQIINTASYFIQKKLKNNTKDIEWQFYIPLSELNLKREDIEVNTLINYITDNEDNFILSRRYNKDTYPLKAKFTGFKNAYRILLQANE